MPTAAFVRLARNGPIIRQRSSEYIFGSICWAWSANAPASPAAARRSERLSEYTRVSDERAAGRRARRSAKPALCSTQTYDETAMTAPAPEPKPNPEPFPQPQPGPATPEETPVRIIELPPNQPSPGTPVDKPLPS